MLKEGARERVVGEEVPGWLGVRVEGEATGDHCTGTCSDTGFKGIVHLLSGGKLGWEQGGQLGGYYSICLGGRW